MPWFMTSGRTCIIILALYIVIPGISGAAYQYITCLARSANLVTTHRSSTKVHYRVHDRIGESSLFHDVRS